jgi:hypothetical protein
MIVSWGVVGDPKGGDGIWLKLENIGQSVGVVPETTGGAQLNSDFFSK